MEAEDIPRPKSACLTVLSGEAILTSRTVPLNAADANQAPRLALNVTGNALRLLPVEVADTVSVGDLEPRRVPSPLEDAALSDGEATVRGDTPPPRGEAVLKTPVYDVESDILRKTASLRCLRLLNFLLVLLLQLTLLVFLLQLTLPQMSMM